MVGVRNNDPPARPGHTQHFPQEGAGIGDMLEKPLAVDRIKGSILEWDGRDLSNLVCNPTLHPGLARFLIGQPDHLAVMVNPDHFPLRADQPAQREGIQTRAAADIQNCLAGLDVHPFVAALLDWPGELQDGLQIMGIDVTKVGARFFHRGTSWNLVFILPRSMACAANARL